MAPNRPDFSATAKTTYERRIATLASERDEAYEEARTLQKENLRLEMETTIANRDAMQFKRDRKHALDENVQLRQQICDHDA